MSVPPENVRKPSLSDGFRGYRNVTLGEYGLTKSTKSAFFYD